MSDVNFDSLLEVNMDDIKALPLLPRGTYKLTIMNREFLESSKKKTPGCQFSCSKLVPGDDIALDEWEECQQAYKEQDKDPSEREFKYTFWLSKAALPMFKQFLEMLGIDVTGRQLGECIEEAIGQDIGAFITSETGDSGNVYNVIQSFKEI